MLLPLGPYGPIFPREAKMTKKKQVFETEHHASLVLQVPGTMAVLYLNGEYWRTVRQGAARLHVPARSIVTVQDDYGHPVHGHFEASVELPDPNPIEIPLEYSRPLTIQEEMKRFLVQELNKSRSYDQGSFEDEDDFEIEDDEPDWVSGYEYEDLIPEDAPGYDRLDEPSAPTPDQQPEASAEDQPLAAADDQQKTA
ncbi:hypothetical protein [Microviridae sp.]|nr:hypothetical protein [Microviridae sp.]